MKLVSPKTLLASLLGCTFVVMKVMTFDGLVDMFWIIFIGYLTVKAIVTAFSQEAYDEDIRQAQQGKVLYRDLFGKFAYIAADVPILLILLAGLLASVCSATTLLRATLIGLLLIAVGYAIWFSWYVSKHKRLRMENGEWGTGILSTEDEKAWKRSNLWHGIILGITGVLFALYLISEIRGFISITPNWKKHYPLWTVTASLWRRLSPLNGPLYIPLIPIPQRNALSEWSVQKAPL